MCMDSPSREASMSFSFFHPIQVGSNSSFVVWGGLDSFFFFFFVSFLILKRRILVLEEQILTYNRQPFSVPGFREADKKSQKLSPFE